jgi:hypothetical protein
MKNRLEKEKLGIFSFDLQKKLSMKLNKIAKIYEKTF